MSRKQISSSEALAIARQYYAFARVGVGGLALVFYTGDELQPGTWLEIGKTGMTAAGMVDENSVRQIIGA